MDFRLDRTAFSHQSHEQEDRKKSFKNLSVTERLEIAFYLNSIAFNFDRRNPPRMDKTIFSIRRRG